MSAKQLILLVAVAATAATAVYANQRHADQVEKGGSALPAAEGVPVPQIVITAKREHGAE
ncbi:MAG: hypothetical protein JOZ85_08580 [Betaproteobacteria bacterium]|nr:hypothetical protein [Betaproteobacteria bacterium]